MVIVKVTSGTHNIALEVEDDQIGHFLISDESSNAREYLLEFLAAGYLEGRQEWNEARIRNDLLISIPSLNLKYILQKELPEHEPQPQAEEQDLDQPQSTLTEQHFDEPQQVVEQHLDQPRVNKHIKNKGSTRWTYQATQRLIFHWKERKDRFENNVEKNETIWEELTEAMIAEGFPNINASHCENKFKYLKRVYMETKDVNRKSTGQPEKTCSFYEEMDSIFKKSPQVCPPSLASSRDGASNQSSSRECSSRGSAPLNQSTTNTTPTEPSDSHRARTGRTGTETQTNRGPAVKKTRLESSLTKWAEKFEEKSSEREAARQKRHEELMQVQRESNDLYRIMMMKLLEKL